MSDADQVSFATPVAVMDSNVLLEIISCIDVMETYEKEGIDPTGPEATLRRQKARDSLILSVCLSRSKSTTYSLHEAMRITQCKVVPGVSDRFENHALIVWANYVKDNVLPDWEMIGPSDGEGEPSGNGADALLVQRAKEYGVPLISHEGVKVTGIDEKSGIRKKARAAGVSIVTPRQYFGEIDEVLHCALFLQRYDDGAEAYARSDDRPEVMRKIMRTLRGYYRHILYGVAVGEREPLSVRLA